MPSRLGHELYKKIDRLKNIFRCIRPVARLFKRGVHMCMGLITIIMYSQQGLKYFLLTFMHVLVTSAC